MRNKLARVVEPSTSRSRNCSVPKIRGMSLLALALFDASASRAEDRSRDKERLERFEKKVGFFSVRQLRHEIRLPDYEPGLRDL